MCPTAVTPPDRQQAADRQDCGPSLTIRTCLVALVVSLFVPFTIFAGVIAHKLAEGERAAYVGGLQSTTRALAIAIDRKIADVSNSLKVLATAELLWLEEFEGLHRFARRVARDRPELKRLTLVQPDGRVLFDTNSAYGTEVGEVVMPGTLERAIAIGAPVIEPVLTHSGTFDIGTITVLVPTRVKDGEIKYVLVAFLELFVIGDIFREQKLPPDWTGVVLDDNAIILGRSRSSDIYVGQPAPSALRSAISGKREGIARYSTQEGWPMLAAFTRSALTGWTVVLGMPQASVDTAAGKALAMIVVPGAAISLLALAFAAVLGHQISRSVLGLLEPALAIARGEPIKSLRRSGIAEIQRVTDKLMRASEILAEREQQRRRAEGHLARAQRVAAIGSWELMRETGAFHWSDETFRIFGVAPDVFRPTPEALSSIVLGEDLMNFRRPIVLALRGYPPTPADLSQDVRIKRPDGAVRLLHIEGEPVLDSDGKLAGLIGTVQDVTESRAAEAKRRELEQQLRQTQKMEALGQLTGGIAHDFNNLLAVIIGNLEMAVDRQRRGLPATDLDEASLRAATRGAALTQQLLAFARRQPLRPVCHDLRRLVEGMLPILKRAATEKITLVFEPPDEACCAEIDGGQFEAALLNLVINARDAMPNGGILTIAIRRTDESPAPYDTTGPTAGEYVEVAVKDTGIGMTREVAARAFEPFFTTKGPRKGSGLGLSMVYGFVRQSGGRVEIESAPGVGTTVKLYFKRVEEPRPSGEIEKAPRMTFETLNVLLVEDEPDVRATVCSMLRDLGANVVAASDGAMALEILKADQSINAIITDIMMPGRMDGITLAERARALRPDVRIAFMSGHAELDDRMLLAVNERPFLDKPLRKYELAAVLEALIC